MRQKHYTTSVPLKTRVSSTLLFLNRPGSPGVPAGCCAASRWWLALHTGAARGQSHPLACPEEAGGIFHAWPGHHQHQRVLAAESAWGRTVHAREAAAQAETPSVEGGCRPALAHLLSKPRGGAEQGPQALHLAACAAATAATAQPTTPSSCPSTAPGRPRLVLQVSLPFKPRAFEYVSIHSIASFLLVSFFAYRQF